MDFPSFLRSGDRPERLDAATSMDANTSPGKGGLLAGASVPESFLAMR